MKDIVVNCKTLHATKIKYIENINEHNCFLKMNWEDFIEKVIENHLKLPFLLIGGNSLLGEGLQSNRQLALFFQS